MSDNCIFFFLHAHKCESWQLQTIKMDFKNYIKLIVTTNFARHVKTITDLLLEILFIQNYKGP